MTLKLSSDLVAQALGVISTRPQQEPGATALLHRAHLSSIQYKASIRQWVLKTIRGLKLVQALHREQTVLVQIGIRPLVGQRVGLHQA